MLGTRTETKNVNSFRSVERAARYEMRRHAAILDDGGSILQETRHWQEDTGITTSGREKSDADDYRYFPEPDLVPVAPSREWVEELRGTLPENPTVKRARLQADWGFTDLEMRDTVGAGAFGLVEETVAAGLPAAGRPQVVAHRAGPPRQRVRRRHRRPRRLAGPGGRRAGAGRRQTINDKLARQVFDGLLAGEGTPEEIVAARGLAIVSDEGALGAAVDDGDRRQPRRRPEDPRRQARRRRRADRRGHEGDARPGRRRPGARAGARAAGLRSLRHATPPVVALTALRGWAVGRPCAAAGAPGRPGRRPRPVTRR